MDVSDVYPRRLPDLFVGRPVVLTGRFNGEPGAALRIWGKAGRQRVEMRVPVGDNNPSAANRALPSVWARARISDLSDQMTYSWNPVLPSRIKQTALDYGLMSPYTAFIAADASRRSDGVEGVTVPVAVPVPDGVRYGTVGNVER